MHEILTSSQMSKADALTIEGGIPGIVLMENAGAAVAATAGEICPEGPVHIIAGPGNNGGDGFAAAQYLREQGRAVTIALLGDPGTLKGDARIAYDRWTGAVAPATEALPECALIIDALFGTGLSRNVSGHAAEIISAVNHAGTPVLAADIPSGLDADTGQPMGIATKCIATTTFFRQKPVHLLQPGRRLCGRINVAQIGIPATVLDQISPDCFENSPALWQRELRSPKTGSHKYTRGHALVVSGGMSQTGAARLAAEAALRAGAGLTTLLSPGGALMVNAAHLTAIMLRRVDDASELTEVLADGRCSAIALGPALGTGNRERAMVLAALSADLCVVLDADALTMFDGDADQLFQAILPRTAPVIITPHEGEFRRLFPNLSCPADISRIERAQDASARSGATVILKGPDTIIATPDGRTAINSAAPAWLATAGSGDVLTGIATGLMAQGMPAFDAATAAVWMHGQAAIVAGPGLIAEDLAPALRPVVADLMKG